MMAGFPTVNTVLAQPLGAHKVVLSPSRGLKEADLSYHSRLPGKPQHILFISFMYLVGFLVLFTAMLYVSSAGK